MSVASCMTSPGLSRNFAVDHCRSFNGVIYNMTPSILLKPANHVVVVVLNVIFRPGVCIDLSPCILIELHFKCNTM